MIKTLSINSKKKGILNMKKYKLLKTASATAKKNGLQLFKNSINNKYALLDAEGL